MRVYFKSGNIVNVNDKEAALLIDEISCVYEEQSTIRNRSVKVEIDGVLRGFYAANEIECIK